jgi:hypothetical protein
MSSLQYDRLGIDASNFFSFRCSFFPNIFLNMVKSLIHALTPGITWTKSRQAFGISVHALVG